MSSITPRIRPFSSAYRSCSPKNQDHRIRILHHCNGKDPILYQPRKAVAIIGINGQL